MWIIRRIGTPTAYAGERTYTSDLSQAFHYHNIHKAHIDLRSDEVWEEHRCACQQEHVGKCVPGLSGLPVTT